MKLLKVIDQICGFSNGKSILPSAIKSLRASAAVLFLKTQKSVLLFENPVGEVQLFYSGVLAVYDCPSNSEPFVGGTLY